MNIKFFENCALSDALALLLPILRQANRPPEEEENASPAPLSAGRMPARKDRSVYIKRSQKVIRRRRQSQTMQPVVRRSSSTSPPREVESSAPQKRRTRPARRPSLPMSEFVHCPHAMYCLNSNRCRKHMSGTLLRPQPSGKRYSRRLHGNVDPTTDEPMEEATPSVSDDPVSSASPRSTSTPVPSSDDAPTPMPLLTIETGRMSLATSGLQVPQIRVTHGFEEEAPSDVSFSSEPDSTNSEEPAEVMPMDRLTIEMPVLINQRSPSPESSSSSSSSGQLTPMNESNGATEEEYTLCDLSRSPVAAEFYDLGESNAPASWVDHVEEVHESMIQAGPSLIYDFGYDGYAEAVPFAYFNW